MSNASLPLLVGLCCLSSAHAFAFPARPLTGHQRFMLRGVGACPSKGGGRGVGVLMMGQNGKKDEDLASLAARLQASPRPTRPISPLLIPLLLLSLSPSPSLLLTLPLSCSLCRLPFEEPFVSLPLLVQIGCPVRPPVSRLTLTTLLSFRPLVLLLDHCWTSPRLNSWMDAGLVMTVSSISSSSSGRAGSAPGTTRPRTSSPTSKRTG